MLDLFAKRKLLKDAILSPKILEIPGAFNAICAKLVENNGYKAAYISGAATTCGEFALPDIGLVSLQETVKEVQKITRAINIPCIADADTGFGETAQIPITIKTFEAHGASGVHLEDQVFPKRCGHLAGKELVSKEEMSDKIKAAVKSRKDPNFIVIARCDAFSVSGIEDMIVRLKSYRDAGADMVFPEALTELKQFERVAKEIGVPVLANMTEFGKTPFYTSKQYEDAGCSAVIFPVSLLRHAMGAIQRALETMKAHGNQEPLVPAMYTRQQFYDLIEYDPAKEFTRKY